MKRSTVRNLAPIVSLGVALSASLCLVGCQQPPSVTVTSQIEQVQKLQRIGVMPFTDAPGADAGHSGKVVSGLITSQAMTVRGWRLVERERLAAVVDEIDLQRSSLVDPATAARVGKVLGADGIIVGQVSQYRIGSIPFLFLFTFDQDVYKVDYSFRLISVKTAEVVMTAHASKSSMVSFEQAVSESAAEIFQKVNAAVAPMASAP